MKNHTRVAALCAAGLTLSSCEESIQQESLPIDSPTKESASVDSSISQRVIREVAEILGRSPSSIKESDEFRRDLGADSLDAVEIVMAVEEAFNIAIADEDAERMISVGDVTRYVATKTAGSPKATRPNKSE